MTASTANRLTVLGLACSVCASASVAWTRSSGGLDQPDVEGSNQLARKASVVDLAQRAVVAAGPRLGKGAILVFVGIDAESFDREAGPRLWLGDPTVRVLSDESVPQAVVFRRVGSALEPSFPL